MRAFAILALSATLAACAAPKPTDIVAGEACYRCKRPIVQAEYAADVAQKLHQAGFRAESDLRNEKITYKIREHSLNRLPYQLVVGDKEKADGLVAVRTRGGQDLGQMSVDALIERLQEEVAARSGTA